MQVALEVPMVQTMVMMLLAEEASVEMEEIVTLDLEVHLPGGS